MTTAVERRDGHGARPNRPLSPRARARSYPKQMFDPGLVYPSGVADWWAFMEGLGIDTGTGIKAEGPERLQHAGDRDRASWSRARRSPAR